MELNDDILVLVLVQTTPLQTITNYCIYYVFEICEKLTFINFYTYFIPYIHVSYTHVYSMYVHK